MLCYRCGSHVADGAAKCTVCGQPLAVERRRSTRAPRQAARADTPFASGLALAGRYQLGELIAQGGVGWLYRARDRDVDVDVAVKIIAPKLIQTEPEQARFTKVARRARKVQHPNVVRVYDFGNHEGHYFYTMPFVQGLSLDKIIKLRRDRQQRFVLEEVVSLFTQMAGALDALRGFGPLGCLKPSNVIVLPDILKIAGLPDFAGIPRTPFVAAQRQRGDAAYLAPEAQQEEGEVDARADVYSLAVILAEMLTGRRPGGGGGGLDAELAGLPARVGAALGRALAANPGGRYKRASELIAEIFEREQLFGMEDSASGSYSDPKERTRDLHAGSSGRLAVPDSEPSFELEDQDLAGAELEDFHGPGPRGAPVTLPGEDVFAIPEHLRAASGQPTPEITSRLPAPVRPGAGRVRASSIAWFVLTILIASLAVAAALWYAHRPSGVVIAPIPDAVDVPGGVLPGAVDDEPGKGAAKKPRPATRPPKRRGPGDKPEVDAPEPASAPDATSASALKQLARSMGEGVASASGDRAPATAPTKATLVAADAGADADGPPEPTVPVPAVGTRCPAGMILIESGPFQMGTAASDPMRGFGDLELQPQFVKAFCIDQHEYPNAPGAAPATGLTWFRAKKLCEGRGKRLCSEAEWEKACKGPGGYRFPYGNRFTPGRCNVGGREVVSAGNQALCRSGYGVHDLAGNAAEWTADTISSDLPDRVYKGGSATQADWASRCSARFNLEPGMKEPLLGVRCCANLQ